MNTNNHFYGELFIQIITLSDFLSDFMEKHILKNTFSDFLEKHVGGASRGRASMGLV